MSFCVYGKQNLVTKHSINVQTYRLFPQMDRLTIMMGLLVVEGSSNENLYLVIQQNLDEDEEEKNDILVGLMMTSQSIYANPREDMVVLQKEQEKLELQALFIDFEMDPTEFHGQIEDGIKNWDLDDLWVF